MPAGTLDPRMCPDGGSGRGQVGGGPAGGPVTAEPEVANRRHCFATRCIVTLAASTLGMQRWLGSPNMLLLLLNGFAVPKFVAKWSSVTAGDRSAFSISAEKPGAICMLAGLCIILRDLGRLGMLAGSSGRGVESERL